MSMRHTTRFTAEFGDCDPAQIVFYPDFFRRLFG
jgi:acyl-CoA thioesterase FadM